MKTMQIVMVTLMIGATGVTFSALGAELEAGSADAARKLVTEHLGQPYALTETPKVNGNKATVKASLVDLSCTLELVQSVSANEFGWLIEKVDCDKP